ncbi:MAG: D-aminoacylase [Candidatus Marinimicrobia bacterium]|nr:D-aminoacylase [Candidatus Neomarinimicrobiota bacterium]
MSKSVTRRNFIKTTTIASAGLIAGCSLRNRFDLVIRNGLVLDGLGNPAIKTDLGIVAGKITAIGDLSTATANRKIDAQGLIVAPGFIDIHTHTDVELIANPRAESKIRQGITTEIGGNCGFSPFPLTEADRLELSADWSEEYGVAVNWSDIGGFFSAIKNKGTAFNYASLTGHGDLRAAVVGRNDVDPTPEQLREMEKLLEKSMEMGSLGLSTGLEYAPGSYAETGEIIALSKIVARHGGLYATHMRNEDDTVIEAIEEALTICREAGVSTEISHLKACNKNNWSKVPRILEMVEEAAQNLPVKADRYPYDAWGTGLTSFTPQWARQGNTDERIARLRDPQQAARIMEYANDRARRIGGWDRLLISGCESEANKIWEGIDILTCSKERKMEPAEFVRNLLIEDRLDVGIVGFAMSEDNLKLVLNSPQVMIGSDGSASAPYGILHKGKPHPRYYGTFPRVLGRYVREQKTLSLPEAVKMMTSMPAEKLKLKQRGTLVKNNFADITIFNPTTVIDNATFADPHQYSTGIDYVIVNGKVVIDQGEHTDVMAGELV